MIKARTHLFFESGSTIAFVGRELGPKLRGKIQIRDGRPEIQISTNNVLAYLQLWVIHGVPCSPFPWGPPEDRYGAAFGCLDHYFDRDEPDPEFPPRPLDEEETSAIADLGKDFSTPRNWEGNVLLLGATSGMQLGDGLVTTNRTSYVAEGCAGPHVGSFKNKLFKRFMFDTGHPIMLFFTDDKIDLPISLKDCHFVFDKERNWNAILQSHPLAMCVGCRSGQAKRLATEFNQRGLSVLEDSHPGDYSAIIARNAVFVEKFEKGIGFKS